MMRVISGSAKGRKLKTVRGESTRPIMDRVKENLFNILGRGYTQDCVWLDMFAGTGQVGVEALSRGAELTVFLDLEREAIEVTRENLVRTKLAERSLVLRTDAFSYLRSSGQRFDVIFVAPPQYGELWQQSLKVIDERVSAEAGVLLKPDGVVVVQLDPKEFVPLGLKTLSLVDQRKYGRTMLCFYELTKEEEKEEPEESEA